jgi:ketosteroid isomerase-like protein
MTAADVAVATRLVAAINERDTDTLIALSTDDVEVIPLRAAVEDIVYKGTAGITQWMDDVAETWQELVIELHESIDVEPGVVLGIATFHARGHASDAPTSMPAAVVAWVRDGLVTKAGTYADRAAAERAIAEAR